MIVTRHSRKTFAGADEILAYLRAPRLEDRIGFLRQFAREMAGRADFRDAGADDEDVDRGAVGQTCVHAVPTQSWVAAAAGKRILF